VAQGLRKRGEWTVALFTCTLPFQQASEIITLVIIECCHYLLSCNKEGNINYYYYYYYYYYYHYIRLTAFFQDHLGKPAPER